tara:strand:+ start:108 stop:803 length:696 start_codon:yes stop_codon:yes gene_type:complete
MVGFCYFTMQRSVLERRVEAEKNASKRIEEANKRRQIEEFKKKSFEKTSSELREMVALGKFSEVGERSEQILSEDPENAPALMWWGIALVKLQQYELALEKFEKASQLDQRSAKTYLYWGLTLSLQKKFDEAILKYRTALQLDPESSNAYAYWGGSLANLQNYGEAIKKLEQALELNSYNSIALGLLVDAYFQTRQYDKAWETVARARKGKVDISEESLQRLREVMPEPGS